MAVVNDHPDHTQDGFVVWVIKSIQRLILSVNCKCILGQIICTDAEEINFLCQKIADHNSRRGFNHNTDLDLSERDLLRRQFIPYRGKDLLDLPDFFDGSDHWEHDRDRTISTGA